MRKQADKRQYNARPDGSNDQAYKPKHGRWDKLTDKEKRGKSASFKPGKPVSPSSNKTEVTSQKERYENDDAENFNLEGRNAVLEALNHDKPIDKIFVKKDPEGSLKVILAKARERGIVTVEVEKMKLDSLSVSGKHQGVIAFCPAHEYAEISDMLARAAEKNEEPFILLLDGITDPHNFGAILRTADACGVHGVIIPKRRSAGLTGIVSKTSAGAIEYVLVAKVPNLTHAINELKANGLWVYYGEFTGENLFTSSISGPIALVIGSEGEGVSRLVKEKCDFGLKIPMHGKITSLNASVAAGVLMYEVVRRRHYLIKETL